VSEVSDMIEILAIRARTLRTEPLSTTRHAVLFLRRNITAMEEAAATIKPGVE
jgi:hypothetical protein